MVINKGRAPPSVIDVVDGVIIEKKAWFATSIQRKPNMAIIPKKMEIVSSLSLFRDDKVDKISIFYFLFYFINFYICFKT